jgi:hypothetical protein
MGVTERIAELLQTLPEREIAEVLDFAEYLAARRLRNRKSEGTSGFLDAVAGLQIEAPADYSTHFSDGLYDNRP